MPCIALTPFKHKNGRVYNKGTLLPLCKPKFKACSLATNRTKPGYNAKPFQAQALHKQKTQATERLYKGAPTGTAINILVSDFEPQTYSIKLGNYLTSYHFVLRNYSIKVKHFILLTSQTQSLDPKYRVSQRYELDYLNGSQPQHIFNIKLTNRNKPNQIKDINLICLVLIDLLISVNYCEQIFKLPCAKIS